MTKYLAGAVIATLLLALSNLFIARTAAQPGIGLPSMPGVGDRLYIQGHVPMGCTVTALHGEWVLCDAYWRNLVTGAAYTIQQRAK